MTTLEKFCKALPTFHALTFHLMANKHKEAKPNTKGNYCPMGMMLSPWRTKYGLDCLHRPNYCVSTSK